MKLCTTVGEKKLDGGHPRKMWWDFIKDNVKSIVCCEKMCKS